MLFGKGSYNLRIKEDASAPVWVDSFKPLQVVTILLLPSPKCNKCVKYVDSSNVHLLNWLINPSAILFIAT